MSFFDTVLDFGGRRLLLGHGPQPRVVAAAYEVHGIACYDGLSGRQIWRRKDIKKAQLLSLSRDGERIYAGIEGRSLQVLDMASGDTIATERGCYTRIDSPLGQWSLRDMKSKPMEVWGEASRSFSIPRATFGLLSASFGPDIVAISESAGPVRCFSLDEQVAVWQYDPPRGHHVVKLRWSSDLDSFAAVHWNYQNGGESGLSLITRGGEVRRVHSFKAAEVSFAARGELLITSSGHVIKVADGAVCRDLEQLEPSP